tara:strand:- start:87 stop:437 length:351 start_codon:yes stop_codon:yes gene_type:complete
MVLSVSGVQTAVYTVELTSTQSPKVPTEPPLPSSNLIPAETKLLLGSLRVNVRANEVSLLIPPLDAVELLMVAVGAVVSIVTLPEPLVTAVPAFPRASVNAIEYATAPSVSPDATE